MRKLPGICLSLSTIVMLAGCSGTISASADDVFENVIAPNDNEELTNYYAEGDLIIHQDGKIIEESHFKENVSADGKRMIIQDDKLNNIHSSALNDGEKLISYVEGEDTALSLDLSEEEPLPVLTMKEQVTSMIDTLKSSHDYEIKGEEEILGMDTYHMVLTANEDNSIFGDTEFWVDKETWFVVKTSVQTADMKTEHIYTKVDFSPDFDETTFVLDIPDHVDVQNMEDINPTSTGSVADVETALEQPFLMFPEEVATVENIEMHSLSGTVDREEADLVYLVDDFPAISVSVFPTPEEEMAELGTSEWTVRGQETDYMEEINALTWDEDGLRYSLIIQNPEINVEEVIGMTEKMILSSEFE